MRRAWLPTTVLAILVLGSIAPFASRAVYLDEPQFLKVAQSAIVNWRFPQDTSWVFFGKRYLNLETQTHPPVVEYYLALLIKLIGHFDGVTFRWLFALFPLLAILSFYKLARRFTANPLLVSCLFGASPAFFVISPTLMMDIPMLAFLLAGLACYLDGIESHARLWPASICFIVAAGCGYTALVPLACLFMWSLVSRRPKREWIAIGSAPAAILIWLVLLRSHFGVSPATGLLAYYNFSHFSLTQSVFPIFSFVGGVAVFPWIWFALTEAAHRRVAAGMSVITAFALTFSCDWPSISYRAWFVALASSGIGLLILFAMNAMRKRIRPKPLGYGFLVLWLPATLLFFALFADMISSRYILLCLPPLFLVVFEEVRIAVGAWAIPTTLILSIALAISDARFVNSYPKWVSQNIDPLQRQGFHVWNAGESGLRFYLEQKGIQTVDSADLRPKAGDLIVRQTSFSYALSKDLEPLLVRVYQQYLSDDYPIRTFCRAAGAGFYDSHFGLVPYTLSRAPLDRIEIAEVSPFVTDLPEVVPKDYSSVPLWFPGGVLLKQVTPQMEFRIRVPEDAKVRYDLEGEGSVVVTRNVITLTKENPGAAVWKNFRILPNAWPDN